MEPQGGEDVAGRADRIQRRKGPRYAVRSADGHGRGGHIHRDFLVLGYLLARRQLGFILINTPLSDEFGHELAVFAAGSTGAGVVLLVKAEMADEVAVRVEDAGVFVVPKPLNRALLFGAVKLAQAANRRIMGLQRQNNILQQKIDDIRLVDRAKCALIQYRLLTEPEAHKYIEREAMDSRRTRREVAQAILRMYEGGC